MSICFNRLLQWSVSIYLPAYIFPFYTQNLANQKAWVLVVYLHRTFEPFSWFRHQHLHCFCVAITACQPFKRLKITNGMERGEMMRAIDWWQASILSWPLSLMRFDRIEFVWNPFWHRIGGGHLEFWLVSLVVFVVDKGAIKSGIFMTLFPIDIARVESHDVMW